MNSYHQSINLDFEDIRPYYDSEYQDVIQKLLKLDAFSGAIQSYFSEYPEEQIRQLLLSCQSIKDFQQRIISKVVEKIIKRSLTKLSFSGLEDLDKAQRFLFMSNHRDIILDSAFLNYGLNQAGFSTSEIAIGSNLLEIEWVRDLVRLNKSFIVKRNIPIQEMLVASKTLSAYIDHTIHEKKESIWIAQREGRAKDGNDKTNPGLLKMFGLGIDKPILDQLISLNITPVSISYEYDPCDYLKISELIARESGEIYTKQSGEDVNHMLIGIQGAKGRVQLTFGTSIKADLEQLKEIKNRNAQLKAAAQVIDHQIFKNYHLWPTNYIAADLLQDNQVYSAYYTIEEKEQFCDYMGKRLEGVKESPLASKLFLGMYANPLFNKVSS